MQTQNYGYKAAAITLTLFFAATLCGCSSSPHDLQKLLEKADEASRKGEFEKAKVLLVECSQSANTSQLSTLRLAAINRLCDTEKQLHNDSKAKICMNEAASLAESLVEKENDNSTFLPERQTAVEARLALTRLADWLTEDGAYVSAKGLLSKVQTLDTTLGISPEMTNSAAYKLKQIDKVAFMEHNDVARNLRGNNSTGAEAQTRKKNRNTFRRNFYALIEDCNNHGKALDERALLLALTKIREAYSARDENYRSAFIDACDTLQRNNKTDTALKLLQEDVSALGEVRQEDLDSALPEKIETAEFLCSDLTVIARIQLRLKKYSEARESAQKALNIATQVIGKKSDLVMRNMATISQAFSEEGNHDNGFEWRKKLIALNRSNNLTENNGFFELLYLSAIYHNERGQFAQALPLLKEAYDLKFPGSEKKSERIKILTALGDSYLGLSDSKKAKEKFLEALPLEFDNNPNSQSYHCYSGLVRACQANGELREALKYNDYLSKMIESHGKNWKNSAAAVAYLDGAVILHEIGKIEEAHSLVDKGLKFEKKSGREHLVNTAALLNFKGTLFREQKKFQSEVDCRLIAIAICKKLNPPQPVATSSSFLQLAQCYLVQKRVREAQDAYREVVKNSAASQDPELRFIHVYTEASLALSLLATDGQTKNAEIVKKNLLANYQSTYNPNRKCDAIELATILAALCVALRDSENATGCIKYAQSLYDSSPTELRTCYKKIEKAKQKLKTIKA